MAHYAPFTQAVLHSFVLTDARSTWHASNAPWAEATWAPPQTHRSSSVADEATSSESFVAGSLFVRVTGRPCETVLGSLDYI